MKLSPLDIYNREFNKTTFGYNVKQVDEFLDEVGMAYERLLKEVNALQDENERMKEKLENYKETEERLEKILLTVQETAKEQINQARKEAELIIKRTEIKAEQMEKELREELKEKYQTLQELKESKELFKIRFRTLLESHLKMLDEWEEEKEEAETDYFSLGAEEDIAAGKLDLDD
jgi:cell division initiation protein